MMRGIWIAAACLLTMTAPRAWAETQAETAAAKLCFDYDTPMKKKVAACSALIASKTLDTTVVSAAYYSRGQAYFVAKITQKSDADINKAIQLNPKFTSAILVRGANHYNKKEYDAAIRDYSSVIRLEPARAATYVGRAYVYEAMSDFDRAIADYDTALRLQPDLEKARQGRAFAIATKNAKRPLQELPAASREPAAPGDLASAASQEPPSPTLDAPSATLARERRIALVIGNSSYQAVSALPNPAKDAELVGEAMRRAGIDTTVVRDLDRAGMVNALKAFAEKADAADWAMIYYAGHGIEVAGTNYLIPVDARLRNERDIQDEAVTLQRLLSATEGAHKLRLVVLDACRNNPFAQQMKMASATRAVSRGLARVEPGSGTLVVYAAKEGTTADDGDGVNSPFAASFARRVAEPGVEINMTFRLIRQDVMTATGNHQEPFTYGALPPEALYFAGIGQGTPPPGP